MTFQTAFARIRVAISMRRRRASARGFLGTAAPVAAALVLTCSLALGASSKPPIDLQKPVPVTVTVAPITSFFKNGGGTRFGQLEWRGGLVLSADTEKFGGYSGVLLSPDGRDLIAVSDAGGWLSARIEYKGSRPVGLTDASLGAIMAVDGKPLRRNRDRDAEEIALSAGTLEKGEVLVSFERQNRIVRYRLTSAGLQRPIEIIDPPPALRRQSVDGMEAMTVLKGGPFAGRMVAFSENAGQDGRHDGWIWIGDTPKPLDVVSHGGFALTAAASLDDGTLLLLERRFTIFEGVRMRLRRIDPAAVKPGAVLDGEVLIEADLSSEIDNMEALGVHKDPSGQTVLTIISDDNFNRTLQRTLLLQFTLPSRAQS
jgi:hypothetical protein